MNCSQIMRSYKEMELTMWKVLAHLLKHYGKPILFDEDDQPCIIHEDGLTDVLNLAYVTEVWWDEEGETIRYNGILAGYDDKIEVEAEFIEEMDGRTCSEILQSIPAPIFWELPDYEPEITQLLCGIEECKEWDAFDEEQDLPYDAPERDKFFQEHEEDVRTRAFPTAMERRAYVLGVDDAEGWLETRWRRPDKMYK